MTPQAETQDPVEKELEKEVVMVGYYDEMSIDMDRFKTRVTGVDLESTEETVNETWEAIFYLSELSQQVSNARRTLYLEEDVKDLRERAEEIGIENLVNVEHDLEVSEDKVNSERRAKKSLLAELFEELPEELPPDLIKDGDWGKYKDSENRTIINVRRPDFDNRRVLAKESEREPGNMYETAVNCLSVEFKISMEANSQELIDKYTEEVIVSLHKALSSRDAIGKVRYTSCTTTEEKKGECFVDI